MTTTLRLIPMALATFGMIAALVAPSFAQTVSLTSDLYVVSEGDAQPKVQIELSTPAGATVTAWYGHAAGTAESPSDFYVSDGVMIWTPGQSGPRPVDVFITDDEKIEPDEEFTILVTSVEGAEQGSPSVATIRIIDNDSAGPPDASFFNPDTPDEPTVFVTGQGYLWEVGIRLSRIPEAPMQVQWKSGLTPDVQSVTFDGIHEQIIVITAPVVPTYLVQWEIEILPDGLAPPIDPDLRTGTLAAYAPGRPAWDTSCVVCVFIYLLDMLELSDCDHACSNPACYAETAAATKQLSTVEVLRRYRDEILASTAAGRFYIDLYDQHGPELAWVAVQNLDMVRLLPDMEAAWIPAFEALVNGHGDAYYIVGPMQAQLSQLFDAMESAATGDLAATLAFERARLDLDSVDGMNMDELQEQLESKGGVSVAPVGWGTVKARYGGH